MAELPKLPPVVLVAVKLPILLVVPVGERILAFRTSERQDENRNSPGSLELGYTGRPWLPGVRTKWRDLFDPEPGQGNVTVCCYLPNRSQSE